MPRLTEAARAKINLTLRVHGRRPDGYHDIHSLVAFAGACDSLELDLGGGLDLQVSGPFAEKLEGGNLILRAARAFLERFPAAKAGRFRLRKNLPVAAGIGGGSADAAAALRMLARANPGLFEPGQLLTIALQLGSDVPVCMFSRAWVMSGRGEGGAAANLPATFAVLANPGIPVATSEVFAALNAPPSMTGTGQRIDVPRFSDAHELADYIRITGNELAAPALRLAPAIGEVLKTLNAQKGCLAASMSGSGATCFGIHDGEASSRSAASAIARDHPGWWVVATELS